MEFRMSHFDADAIRALLFGSPTLADPSPR